MYDREAKNHGIYWVDRFGDRELIYRDPEIPCFWLQTVVGSLNTAGMHGGSRVVPGRFGARAAELLDYLDERHYGVKLSDEDLHRMVIWLDCNSEFLGAYEDAEAQARGELVTPQLN